MSAIEVKPLSAEDIASRPARPDDDSVGPRGIAERSVIWALLKRLELLSAQTPEPGHMRVSPLYKGEMDWTSRGPFGIHEVYNYLCDQRREAAGLFTYFVVQFSCVPPASDSGQYHYRMAVLRMLDSNLEYLADCALGSPEGELIRGLRPAEFYDLLDLSRQHSEWARARAEARRMDHAGRQ